MPRIPGKLVGYFFTAGAAAVVDIGGFVLLTHWGVPLVAAATASFLLAAVVNYLLSSRFVFRSRASGRGFLLFASAALVGLGVNVAITYVAATYLSLLPALAKIVGVGTAFLVNFTVNSKLVFRSRG